MRLKMSAEQLKHKIRKILGKQIIFNKDFDKYALQLKNKEQLLSWCKKIKSREIAPIPSSVFNDTIIFIKKIGSSNRCIVIKLKNDEFSELHLASHSYYDKLRRVLGLKK